MIARPDFALPPKNVLCFGRYENGPVPGDYDKFQIDGIRDLAKIIVRAKFISKSEQMIDMTEEVELFKTVSFTGLDNLQLQSQPNQRIYQVGQMLLPQIQMTITFASDTTDPRVRQFTHYLEVIRRKYFHLFNVYDKEVASLLLVRFK
jgi:hypothetical protein